MTSSSERGTVGAMSKGTLRRSMLLAALLTAACTDTINGSTDAGMESGMEAGAPDVVGATRCVSDDDCSDGLFCDGVERCAPVDPRADSNGCLRAGPPCMPTQTCNEFQGRCDSVCDRAPDADGDGHRAISCGGDDCDDADLNRFPGTGREVCDPTQREHDEDCDPATYASSVTMDGDRDGDTDGDGYVLSLIHI